MDTDVERRCACTKGKIFFADRLDDIKAESRARDEDEIF